MNRFGKYVNKSLLYLPFVLAGCVVFIFLLFLFEPSLGELSNPDSFGKLELVMSGGETFILQDDDGYADWAAIDETPENILQAIIGVEDVRFMRHYGVDLTQMYYAFMHIFRPHDFLYGESTITRQLARSVRLGTSASPFKKLFEFTLAIGLEAELTKQEILEWYINTIEMAPGIRGLRAGARYYFAKEPAALSFKEQLFLAAIIHDPSRYAGSAPLAYERMQALARSLFAQARISESQATALSNIQLTFAYARPPAAPEGLRRAVQALWPRALRSGANLRIETGIDAALQERLEAFMLDLRAPGDEVIVHAGADEREPYASGRARALVMASRQGAERMRAYARVMGNVRLFVTPREEADGLIKSFLANDDVRVHTQPITFSEKRVLDTRYNLGLLPVSWEDFRR